MRNETMLRVRMSHKVYKKIEDYAESRGLSVAEAVRCWGSDLDGDMTAEELDKLIARLQARRDTLRPKKTAAAGEGED